MIQPAKIVVNEKIRGFFTLLGLKIEESLQFITSEKVSLSPFDAFLMPRDTYLHAYKKKSVLIKIHAEKLNPCQLYLFFELQTALATGALMRMMPTPAIMERLKAESLDQVDQDSFGEVGNQLCGILDRVFRNYSGKDLHLRMDFDKKIYPDESIKPETFSNKEEYVVLVSTITIPNYTAQKVTLLMPQSYFELLNSQPTRLENINQAPLLLYTHDQDFAAQMSKQINGRYARLLVAPAPDDILHMSKEPALKGIAVHLGPIKFPLDHETTIFLKRFAHHDMFNRVPLIFTFENADPAGIAELTNLGIKNVGPNNVRKIFYTWATKLIPEITTQMTRS
jgi:hypothetical protein